MAAKSERVAQSGTHFALLRLVEREVKCIVEIRILITLFVVDGGGYYIIYYAQHTGHSLYGTSGT